jgi:farnesyl-diphosphate farnesyltransferase
MPLSREAITVLRDTSRTFYIPIVRLPGRVRDAVGSAYLCMRSIDEVEDHPHLAPETKAALLTRIHEILAHGAEIRRLDAPAIREVFLPHRAVLPPVTLALDRFAAMAPAAIADRVWISVAAMARGMAHWARAGFVIRTEQDLDAYTYDVAGRVGELLNEIWQWYDGSAPPRNQAIGFGRGLQAVNILRNREEDLARGVDFYPTGWRSPQVHDYIQRQFLLADAYMAHLDEGPIREFCRIPLALARATVEALRNGRPKLTRDEVGRLVGSGPIDVELR